jgi:hypothetical protein
LLVDLITKFPELIVNVQVQRFRKERHSYQLIAELTISDYSVIFVKEYLFPTGQRKYAYHWQGKDGSFFGRWDNSSHWPDLDTFPHHYHDGKEDKVYRSDIRELKDVLSYIQSLFS